METLYRKTQKGRKTVYVPVEEEETIEMNLTDAQCITAAGALGVTLLTIFERNIPPHKRVAKKIKAVEVAILDLFKGTGQELDDEVANHFCKAWDLAMKSLTYEEPNEVPEN